MKLTWLIRSWRGVLLSLVLLSPAYANVHLTQIEQVIGGVSGDTTAQAVQLRMRAANQKALSATKLWAHSADGTESILLIDFTSNVPNGALGARILVATPNFPGLTSPAATPDFTMNPIPLSYLAAGSITFENNTGTKIYWRLSWENALGAYGGSTTGSTINDADGEFGPPFDGPLPSSDTQALLFFGPATALSTNNFDDYALTVTPAVFTNNAGASFTVTAPIPCVNDDDCDDGDVCNGTETCDIPSGQCQSGTPLDPCCGDGVCVGAANGEDCTTCSADCISGGGGVPVCGNGTCEPGEPGEPGENCNSCPDDCRQKTTGNPSSRYCCDGDLTNCGNTGCSEDGFSCGSGDPFCCGDGVCEGSEDFTNCATDCACGGNNAPCNIDADCCSNNCKNNGRCSRP